MGITSIVLLVFFGCSTFGADLCRYNQDVVPGLVYTLSPSSYSQSGSCFWKFWSATGTNIYISCNIKIPKSIYCYEGVMIISPSGRDDFSDGIQYCGEQSFSLLSSGNVLTLNVISRSTKAGEFPCQLIAVSASSPNVENRTSGCECGWKNMKKIVGGSDTLVNEFPSMAALIRQGAVWCGGSIISYKFVLTAAHCLNGQRAQDLHVLAGDHDISTGNETSSSSIYNVEAFEIHPLYSSFNDYDIGIVKTSTSIVFNQAVGPICLPFKYTYYDFAGQYVTITGWGTKEFSGPLSNVLQKVNVRVLLNYQCEQDTVPSYNNMCTTSKDRDSCQNDSGGPLFWLDTSTGHLYLVGIISHGYGCATGVPGVNVRVTQFLKWIVERTGKETGYCAV